MNQPVATSMRDDYVDEAKRHLYIAIYTVEGMLEKLNYIEPPCRYHLTAFIDALLLKDYMLNPRSS